MLVPREPVAELVRRARLASFAFLAILFPFAAGQLVAAQLLPGSPVVDADVLLWSAALNAALGLLVLVHAVAFLRGPSDRPLVARFYGPSTCFVGLAVLGVWAVQLHVGGSQSCNMIAILVGTLAVLAWLLPRSQVVVLAVFTGAAVLTVVAVELSGALPYAPIFLGHDALRGTFLTWPVIVMNVAILGSTGGVVLVVALSLRAALVRSRAELAAEIDERRAAQQRLQETVRDLERSNRDLEQYAHATSHDLLAPLAAIRAHLDAVAAGGGERLETDARDALARAASTTARMEAFVRDLLAFATVDGERPATLPCAADVALDEALQALAPAVAAADAAIRREPLPAVRCDPGLLAQVFQNLLENALAYRGQRPARVSISARREGSEWCVSVEDAGIGFDPEDAERVFDVFTRLDPDDGVGGTGVGLAICRRIVEQAGGRIWATGRPGEGATFSFTLPAADARPAEA